MVRRDALPSSREVTRLRVRDLKSMEPCLLIISTGLFPHTSLTARLLRLRDALVRGLRNRLLTSTLETAVARAAVGI